MQKGENKKEMGWGPNVSIRELVKIMAKAEKLIATK